MNPNNKTSLEAELIASSFNETYKKVMKVGNEIKSQQEGIIASIAEVSSDVGDLSSLSTVDKSDLVSAVNEIDSHADDNASAIAEIRATKINGYALNEDITLNKSDVGLSNVVNVGSSATPAEDGTDNFTTGGAYTQLALKADDTAVVHNIGNEIIAGVKTFTSAPKVLTLTTATPIPSTAGVGYDESGNLIPIIVSGGGGTALPASADYVYTNAQGESQKGTADTVVTESSTNLVQSGAVYTALQSVAVLQKSYALIVHDQDTFDTWCASPASYHNVAFCSGTYTLSSALVYPSTATGNYHLDSYGDVTISGDYAVEKYPSSTALIYAKGIDFLYNVKYFHSLESCTALDFVSCDRLTNCTATRDFAHCTNVTNCTATRGFDACTNVTNCTAAVFGYCSRLTNCVATGSTSAPYSYGYRSCRGVSRCSASASYPTGVFDADCYASLTTESAAYACADTPEGGFNNPTNPS